jgi:beta-galactosidase
MRSSAFLLTVLLAMTAGAREKVSFDKNWRFVLADSAVMAATDYDDSHWRRLDVPHDWAIEGDFYVGNKSGASGGALPGGVGWYRKKFDVRCKKEDERGKKDDVFLLDFDGVYMNSTVYVNGHEVGHRPYGYSSFEYDITPYVKDGSNVVAVRVDNSDQPNSRWYSGCGIYRHVWLTKTGAVHVRNWGVHVEGMDGRHAPKVVVDYENPNNEKVTVRNTWLDNKGNVVAELSKSRFPSSIKRWSCDAPAVYKLRTELLVKGRVVDKVETVTGFRDFRFDARTGFWLNGQNIKINGVCMHHDMGCLGAALHEDALHRQLLKLKEMGCNAIRCSHNPPAPELLNMCDTMGFIVMDESFDMWRRRKTQNDYARFFDQWAERDLTDMVLRDRNHPSVMMWSIGNEVLEQWSSAEADTLTVEQANLILNAGHDASTLAKDGEQSINAILTRRLADIVRRYDTSRPITAGCNEPSPGNHLFKSGALDIIGFNYHHQWVRDVPKNFPDKPFLFTESVSALQSRGFYMMPSDSVYIAPREWWLPYTDPSMQCSAYDNMHASWSSTHEELWDVVKHTPYVGGQFIWTGWDYIGEPTPYGFPARSSYFGIIDLAGFPKDVYYMYQSEWADKHVLYLFPHWNWIDGQTVDMWCYYNNADEVELFVNGKSKGVRRKGDHDYHVAWRVSYEPGEVTVVARKDGRQVARQSRRTAGQPATVALHTDYSGRDLSFVFADIVDSNGTLCPHAADELFFEGGDGLEIVATDNGCQTSMERFTAPHRHAYNGRCLVVVRGKGVLTVRGYGLQAQTLRLQ